MPPNDFAIGPTSVVPSGGVISKKPNYLITLEDNSCKSKVLTRFITLDKPDFLDGFILVKGIFTDIEEDAVINNISNILTTLKKELILEVMFPHHRIHSIRSLVFNAIKSQTVVK